MTDKKISMEQFDTFLQVGAEIGKLVSLTRGDGDKPSEDGVTNLRNRIAEMGEMALKGYLFFAIVTLEESFRETEKLSNRVEDLLAEMWEMKMEAVRATTDEPAWALPTRITNRAVAALGEDYDRAQELAQRNLDNSK